MSLLFLIFSLFTSHWAFVHPLVLPRGLSHSLVSSVLKSTPLSSSPISLSTNKVDVSSSSTTTGAVDKVSSSNPCRIKVIGVGGGGGNAVNRMMESSGRVSGVEFWVVNTDMQALAKSSVSNKLAIGASTSRGLGAGGSAAVGRKAGEESRGDLQKLTIDADLIFVTAGMGGGTGSGAAPIVAECAKKAKALTVGVVTKPFKFEGKKRMEQALEGIENMRKYVDTLIIVSNEKLKDIVPSDTPLNQAFSIADEVLRQGVVGIAEIIVRPGLVNVDFADIRSVMGNAGNALMGVGRAKGKNRAVTAARLALASPLLELPSSSNSNSRATSTYLFSTPKEHSVSKGVTSASVMKAKGVILYVSGGEDVSLNEIHEAAKETARIIGGGDPEKVEKENEKTDKKEVSDDMNLIFGATVDERIKNGEISVTVIATGLTEIEKKENEVSEKEIEKVKNNVVVSRVSSGVDPFALALENNNDKKSENSDNREVKTTLNEELISDNKNNKDNKVEMTVGKYKRMKELEELEELQKLKEEVDEQRDYKRDEFLKNKKYNEEKIEKRRIEFKDENDDEEEVEVAPKKNSGIMGFFKRILSAFGF